MKIKSVIRFRLSVVRILSISYQFIRSETERLKTGQLQSENRKLRTDNWANAGYTIAELIAVITIFVIISGIMVSVIYSTIRGSSKTKLTTDISQNGQYASTVMTNIISDSRNILQINGSDFDSCSGSPSPNSDILTPTVIPSIYPATVDSITLKRIDGGKTVLTCGPLAAGGTDTIASNGASLINMNVVKVSNCKITCSQLVLDPYSVPIVDVSFTLSPVNVNTYDSQTSSTFNFSTSLRVYSP